MVWSTSDGVGSGQGKCDDELNLLLAESNEKCFINYGHFDLS